MKIGLAVCAAVLAASPALAATAANPFSADTAVLDLSGINFASVDGQKRLAIRMDDVANKVCGQGMSTIHLALGAQARGCRADVIADIRARVAVATAAREPARGTQLAAR
ncbi:UrcA family protein [Sphingomonas montana]|uniref:UrcA family protein n=1 Tax=Sphingomonas montana TaxID=1843236 RepID=UPI0019D186A6|nr:UrcA family protein [Sphingomonas montana]